MGYEPLFKGRGTNMTQEPIFYSLYVKKKYGAARYYANDSDTTYLQKQPANAGRYQPIRTE